VFGIRRAAAQSTTLSYVPLDICDAVGHRLPCRVNTRVADRRSAGEGYWWGLMGPEKSSTAPRCSSKLTRRFRHGESRRFPVFLNLRGSSRPDRSVEVSSDMRSELRFQSPQALVAGWRGGYCDLILDGFRLRSPQPVGPASTKNCATSDFQVDGADSEHPDRVSTGHWDTSYRARALLRFGSRDGRVPQAPAGATLPLGSPNFPRRKSRSI